VDKLLLNTKPVL